MALRLDGGEADLQGLAAFASLFVSEQGVNRFAEHDLDFQITAGPVHVAGLTAESLDAALRLKAAVATGELRPADSLPSVRQLAGTLRINPATVVQAYRSLETDGFVEIRQGAGTYVRAVPGDHRARERSAQARRLVRGRPFRPAPEAPSGSAEVLG